MNKPTYDEKVASRMKTLLYASDISIKEAADALRIKEQSLRNKFVRNSFSINDVIALCNICGYEVIVRPKNRKELTLW